MPLGPAPGDAELTATSMCSGQERPDAGRVEVETLPAVLALYLDLPKMRARYGLRALRFALLEAGHLAQNLALVAAAEGLSLGILDGIDDVLVYLLPLGRSRT